MDKPNELDLLGDRRMIPILWMGGGGNWDTAFPRFILDQATPCDHLETIDVASELPQNIAVICIPGRHSNTAYAPINRAAKYFEKVVFLIYGDEEALFQPEELDHKDRKIWWFMPRWPKTSEIDRVAINGWPTGCREILAQQKQSVDVRDLDWSFQGQVTHLRRQQCADGVKNLVLGAPQLMGEFFGTPGFTQGKPRPEYYHTMLRSKIILCPSGPQTPDSFRIAEALEAGCIPIVDELTPNPAYPPGYWQYVFKTTHFPFPLVQDWAFLPALVDRILWDYPQRFYRCALFWAEYKMRLVDQMREDLRR